MNQLLRLGMLFSCFLGSWLWAQGTGISVYPLQVNNGHMTTEYVGLVQHGKGSGLQVRYTHKMNAITSLEAGVGLGNADLTDRAFLVADIELFPDYDQQPRVSLRPFLQTTHEFGSRRTLLGATPTFSKTLMVGDRPIYPFLGVPVALVLDTNQQRYNFRTLLAFGVAGKLPFEEMKNVLFNAEANVNLSNSFSSLFFGISYPIL